MAFPSGPDLIRVCLQQAMAAQARDTGTQQQSQQQASPSVAGETPPQAPWQGPLSPPASASQHKRTKLLASWAAKVKPASAVVSESITDCPGVRRLGTF